MKTLMEAFPNLVSRKMQQLLLTNVWRNALK
jgi:hypothetical protein